MGTFCVYNYIFFQIVGVKMYEKVVIQMVRKTDSNDISNDINTLSLSYYNVNKLCISIPVN